MATSSADDGRCDKANCHGKRPYTVVVEGNIGSGKTTFLQRFVDPGDHSDKVEVLSEPVDMWRNCHGHNLLNLMYQEPSRYSLAFQTYVQLTMVKLHHKDTDKPLKMMERSLLSTRCCFVENLHTSGLLADSEYSVLSEWHNFLVTCPLVHVNIDQIIYLRTNPETVLDRIRKRNRPEEADVSLKYLQELHDLHENWLYHKTKFQPLPAPVMIVDSDEDIATLSTKYDAIKNLLLTKVR